MGTQRYACHWQGPGRASAVHRKRPKRCQRQVPDKVGKRSETSAMFTKSTVVRNMVGNDPADRHRGYTDFSKSKRIPPIEWEILTLA